MKETLLQYAGYNVWANKRIIEVMMKLDAAQLNKEIVSSFPSLQKTVSHIWSAEFTWLQRLQLAEQPIWAEDGFQGDFKEACVRWQEVSFQLQEFVTRQFNDAAFDHVLQYYTRKSQPYKNKVGDVLLHVFNHSTFHRGQLITMLRQAGVTNIPPTDFIAYLR
ncbi:MAG TPA: DinB family protein [Flavipsychrobacter sp.]|nr:DinB family protein [Flavipsychrobacter sp.]